MSIGHEIIQNFMTLSVQGNITLITLRVQFKQRCLLALFFFRLTFHNDLLHYYIKDSC